MPSRRRRWRRYILRLARTLLLVYLGLCIVFYALQTWMIFPGRATQGQRHAQLASSRHYELIELQTPSGDRIVAAFGNALGPDNAPLADAESRPTILFFYGNGMCLADAMEQFWEFRRLGANVMIPDFAGYGMSGGKPSEQSFYATADASWAHLMARGDIDKSKIILAGWSIGAAVAIDLASRERAAALATFSAFTSLPDMARHLFRWLPAGWLLRHRFESATKLSRIDVPMLIVHGRGDRIIPFEMSQQLAKAAKGKVTTLWIDSDHNDLFAAGAEQILPALQHFIEDLPPR